MRDVIFNRVVGEGLTEKVTSQGRQERAGKNQKDIPDQSIPGTIREQLHRPVCQSSMSRSEGCGSGGHVMGLCYLDVGCKDFTFALNGIRSYREF